MFQVGGAGWGWGELGVAPPPPQDCLKGVQPQFDDHSHLLYLTQLPTAVSLNLLKLLNNRFTLFR